jgi:hypothetical protein
VIGILPGRLATRQRLFIGAMVVVGTSLLNLIAVEAGPFGSPWPIALLWAACGWAGLGPNVTTAGLLFVLGLWVDALTGAPMGTWALVTLLTHGLTILSARFLGVGNLGYVGNASISGLFMILISILVSVLRGTSFYLIGMISPVLGAIVVYHFLGRLFELSEDET